MTLGEVIVHGEAELAIQQAGQTIQEFLDRFEADDLGDIDAETRQFNQDSRRDGEDVLGCYELCSGLPLWIIGDGESTEVILP